MPNAAQQLARQGRDLALKAAAKGIRVARSGAEHVLERAFGGNAAKQRVSRPGEPAPPPRWQPPAPTAAEAVEAERAEARAWRPSEADPSPPDPALEHVTEEATLAGESADAGAEDGAGPEVSVGRPWHGYDWMKARDIVDRLDGADAAVAGAVRLYEAAGKARKTVLEAAERSVRR